MRWSPIKRKIKLVGGNAGEQAEGERGNMDIGIVLTKFKSPKKAG